MSMVLVEQELYTQVPNTTYKRGDVWLADLNGNYGSEQGGMRPILILQNDIGNKYSPTVICAILSTRVKKEMPTHVRLNAKEHGLIQNSIVLLEQLKTVDKLCLMNKLTHIDDHTMQEIDKALMISVGLFN